MLLKVTEMMKNQFYLKPKGMTFSYKFPYPEWYDLVALPTNYRLLEFACSVESRSHARVGRNRRQGLLRKPKKEWWSVFIDRVRIIIDFEMTH